MNLLGVISCTRALVPDMIHQRSGVILNVATIAGRLPLTPTGTYAAAKHGVYAFSQILDDELARFDITVCVVCPGRVQTSFFATAPPRHPPLSPYEPSPTASSASSMDASNTTSLRTDTPPGAKPSNSELDTNPSWEV